MRRAAVLVLLMAALAVAPRGPAGAASPAVLQTGNWLAVLAAGDYVQQVFDDATRALAQRLRAAGVPPGEIHRLSASADQRQRGVEPTTLSVLLRQIARLPARPGDRCFVFLTSHGEEGAGLWLALSDRALRPSELAAALSRGCAAVPTVVIVSGCYTGAFAGGTMRRPNRIILTAARADRPSFGCQAGRVYTFFDQCLLGALVPSRTWRAVSAATDRCVARLERSLGARPSEPQSYFGAAVFNLQVGF